MTTYIDSFAQATGQTDTTAIGSSATYKFGYMIDRAEILDISLNRSIQQINKSGQYYPTLSGGNAPFDRITASFQMVNGIPFYALFGKATHTVANDTQTIEPFTNTEGAKPRYKVCQIIDSRQTEIYGVIWHDLNISFSRGRMTTTMMGKGLTHLISSTLSASQSFPSDESDMFNVFDSFTWNANNINNVISTEFKASQNVIPYYNSNGYYSKISEYSPVMSAMTVAFVGEDTNFEDDYYNGTKRELKWKILKGADTSKYFEITSDAYIAQLSKVKVGGEIVGITASLILEKPTIVVKDGLSDTFYEVPT